MDRLVGFLKTASWLVFLGALMWSYAYLPLQVTYRVDDTGAALSVMSKSSFFFASLGFFLVINIICIIFIRTLRKIETSDEGAGLRNRSLKKDILTWVNGFVAILNFFFAQILIFIGLMNGTEEFEMSILGGYVYLGPILILLWFFYLIRVLSKKRG